MSEPITLSILLLDDTAGEITDDGGECDTLFYDAVSALLDELATGHLSPVWPETAETVALMLGWDPNIVSAAEREQARDELRRQAAAAPVIADSDNLERELLRVAQLATAPMPMPMPTAATSVATLTAAEHTVLAAARALACAQREVETSLDAWAACADETTDTREYARLTAARRARNDAADRLYDAASSELAASLAGDVPTFLRAYLPATNGAHEGAPQRC